MLYLTFQSVQKIAYAKIKMLFVYFLLSSFFYFSCFAQDIVSPMDQCHKKVSVQQYEPPLKRTKIEKEEGEKESLFLLDLPPEVVWHIFTFIKPLDLLKISTTCSLFNDVTKNLCKDQRICLSERNLEDKQILGISQQTTLYSFRLLLNQYTTEHISLFAGSRLRRLNLSHCQLGDPGAYALAKSSSLFKLSLAFCDISDEGAIALFKNPVIRKINLSHNDLTDKCLESFSIHNQTLLGLNLRYNKLTEAGAMSLAKSSTLRSVYLFANRIGYAGIEKLIQSNITKIELGGYKISPEDTSRMQALLKEEHFKDKEVVFH